METVFDDPDPITRDLEMLHDMGAGSARHSSNLPCKPHGTFEPDPSVKKSLPSVQGKKVMPDVMNSKNRLFPREKKHQVINITSDMINVGIKTAQRANILKKPRG
jgi:hypothetical protein